MTNTISPQEVGNWQRFLNEHGIYDQAGKPLVVDESFGPRSSFATSQWQADHKLATTGFVANPDKILAQKQGFIPFIQAKNYNLLFPKNRTITVIVIHTMEYPEKPTGAEWCADFFAGRNGMTAPKASAHYCVDQDSVVQCVRDSDIAWHAPGCNHNGIGVEHNGYARKSAGEWIEDLSWRTLDMSARLCAKLAKLYAIPLVKLTPAQLVQKEHGFCGHVDATGAFPGPGRTHTDPGPGFPWSHYLSLVKVYS